MKLLHPLKHGTGDLMGFRRLNITSVYGNEFMGPCTEKARSRAACCHGNRKLCLVAITLICGSGKHGELAGVNAANALKHIINPLTL